MEKIDNYEPQSKMFGPIVLTILLSAIIFGGLGYYLGKVYTSGANKPIVYSSPTPSPSPSVSISPSPTVSPSASAISTADWKTYTNAKYGFSFQYPKGTILNQLLKSSPIVYVEATKIVDITEGTGDYTKENATKDRDALLKGDPTVRFVGAIKSSYKKLIINGMVGKELTYFIDSDCGDIEFRRKAIIYKGDTQIIITVDYPLQYDDRNNDPIIKNNPQYFEEGGIRCGVSLKIWKAEGPDNFYSDLVAGKTDTVSQNWYKTFDAIISTFKVTN